MRSARSERQSATRNEIKRTHLAPYIEDNSTQRITGKRVEGRTQRRLGILRPHGHQKARIKSEFLQAAHGERAGFALRKVLLHPDQRTPPDQTMGQARDEPCRRHAMSATFSEHLMQRAAHQAALQHSVSRSVTERHPRKTIRLAFKTSDSPPQGRKRACACAIHARRSLEIGSVSRC